MPTDSTPITLVVFRRWKENGDIIALFPELPSDIDGFYCDAYEHVGQHGGADYYGVTQATRPVTRSEARSLAAELCRIAEALGLIVPRLGTPLFFVSLSHGIRNACLSQD